LVEKEISKTLNETEKRLTHHPQTSPLKSIPNTNHPIPPPPPPLVTPNKSHSQYSSHPPQQYFNKGSIMRGTPISSSTPTTKPIAVDISSHPHHYNSPRNEYSYLKSPKVLDRNIEQQQHLLQQQQQHAAYLRHYTHHQQQYLQPQQQQQQQHKTSTNKIEPPSTDTFETLRADYVTSKYLTTTHSPNER
jgi:hypothetical protein